MKSSSCGKRPPRIIAHRGLSGLCPENTLPAFAAAISLNVDEIEFDLWGSKDRVMVVCHDESLDRTTNKSGRIRDLCWDEIQSADASATIPGWSHISVPRFEEILDLFGGKITMNIHLKEAGEEGWIITDIAKLCHTRGIEDTVYITGTRAILEEALRCAPHLPRCCIEGAEDMTIVEHAIRFECARLQFRNQKVTLEMVQKAHNHGILCNVFYADTVEETERLVAIGCDAVLTNFANRLLPFFKER